jgi:hypothetical protein
MNWTLTSSTIVIVFLLAECRVFPRSKSHLSRFRSIRPATACYKVQWNFAGLVMNESGIAKPQALVSTQEAVDQGGLLAR